MHQNSLYDQRQSADNDSYLNIAFRGKKTYDMAGIYILTLVSNTSLSNDLLIAFDKRVIFKYLQFYLTACERILNHLAKNIS